MGKDTIDNLERELGKETKTGCKDLEVMGIEMKTEPMRANEITNWDNIKRKEKKARTELEDTLNNS